MDSDSNNNNSSKDAEPVKVSSRIVFLKVGEIDSKSENFRAEAFIESCWEDNSLLKYSQLIKSEKFIYHPKEHWNPEIYIENSIGSLQEEKIQYKIDLVERDSTYNPRPDQLAYEESPSRTTSRISNPSVRITEMRKIKGVFYERLELDNFPIDLQELSIRITSKKSNENVVFLESRLAESSISTDDFQDQQQWELFESVKPAEDKVYDNFRKFERAQFKVSAFVVRKHRFYLNNAVLLIFLITSIGFTPFCIPVASPHFRCQITGLLLLTSVNFRWIITQRLPAVSYLTMFDKYSIACLLVLVLLCVWHSIIGSSVITSENTKIDAYALYTFSVLYFLLHLVFFLWFLKLYNSVQVFREEQKQDQLNRSKRNHDPKIQKLD